MTTKKKDVGPLPGPEVEEKKPATALEILSEVQRRVAAPKGRRNEFGGFDYRNCEDILMAVKPVITEYGGAIVLTDDIREIGGRFYVEATATMHAPDGTSISNMSPSREPDVKKGMDPMQLTGAASSYARKYALAGLFALDNNKDADSMDNRPAESEQDDQYHSVEDAYRAARLNIKAHCDKHGYDAKDVGAWMAGRLECPLDSMSNIDQIVEAVDIVIAEYKPRTGDKVSGDIPGEVVDVSE